MVLSETSHLVAMHGCLIAVVGAVLSWLGQEDLSNFMCIVIALAAGQTMIPRFWDAQD